MPLDLSKFSVGESSSGKNRLASLTNSLPAVKEGVVAGSLPSNCTKPYTPFPNS